MSKRKKPQYVIALIRTSDTKLVASVNVIKDKLNITHEEIYRRGVLDVQKQIKKRKIRTIVPWYNRQKNNFVL